MTYRVLLIIAALFCLQAPARAETEVDVMLVLAVDVSRSMDQDEQQLQRAGYVEAFRSPVVHDAIDKGALGRVAVVYVEWSGPSDQKSWCRGQCLAMRPPQPPLRTRCRARPSVSCSQPQFPARLISASACQRKAESWRRVG